MIKSFPSSFGAKGLPCRLVTAASSDNRSAASFAAGARCFGSWVEAASRQLERPAINPDPPARQAISTWVLKASYPTPADNSIQGTSTPASRGSENSAHSRTN